MKKIIIIVLAVVIAISSIAGFFIISNLNDEPAKIVEQTVSRPEPAQSKDVPATAASPVFIANFIDGDALHSGSGSVRLSNTADGPLLIFGPEFKVTNGPDLFVYLSPNKPGESLGSFASLGRLQNIKGAQSYNAPKDFANYKTVVIWCRGLSVTFATAELTQQK